LVPVDVDPKREADIPMQAVRLNDLMNALGALPTRMRIFMLDACRNNPFPALNQAGHGLAIVDTEAGAPGSFISYSTSPGAEAEDGTGADSPYTTALLAVAKEHNLPIEEAFKRVRVAVSQTTDGRQIPWESSSLTADFKFFPADAASGANAAAPKSPVTAKRSVDDWRRELQGKNRVSPMISSSPTIRLRATKSLSRCLRNRRTRSERARCLNAGGRCWHGKPPSPSIRRHRSRPSSQIMQTAI
jgi:Caspase domain